MPNGAASAGSGVGELDNSVRSPPWTAKALTALAPESTTHSVSPLGASREIPWGEPYMSLDYHIERTERPGYIEVERAESLLTACVDCAPSRLALARALLDLAFPWPSIRTTRRTCKGYRGIREAQQYTLLTWLC